jgi:putative DNA primase/helicase
LTTRDYGGVAFIDLVLGYLVTTGNPLQVAVLLLGSGGNGKTLFLRVVEALLGRDNYSAVSLRDLSDNRFRAHSMYGKIANICGDLDSRRLESTDMFKRVTGGDVIGAEQKYGRAFEFVPQAVPLFSANAVFGTPDTSDGYFRRWLIIPFPNSFVGREDATLLGRLTAEPERQGILARAVRGARALGALGRFPVPPSIAQAQTQFREESDPIRAYIADCLEVAPGHSVTQKDAYDIYRVWAAANGRGELASATFGSRLGEAGITRGVTMGKKMLRGVALTVRAVHGELIPLRQDQTDDQDPLAGLVG